MAEGHPPSRKWYVPAFVLVAGAAIVGGLATFMSINSVSFTSVELPGSSTFEVATPGMWVVCIESIDDQPLENPGLEIQFSTAGEPPIPLKSMSGRLTYSIGGVHGVGIGSAVLGHPGTWTITGRLPDGQEKSGGLYRYAFGPNPLEGVLWPILIGGGIAVILVSLGVATWGLVFWMRFKAMRVATAMEG